MNTLNELNSLHNSKFAKNEAFLFLSFYIDFLIGRRLSKKKRHFRLWLKNRFNHLRKNISSLWSIIFYRKLGKKKQRFRLWRQKFLSGLAAIGLDVEEVGTCFLIARFTFFYFFIFFGRLAYGKSANLTKKSSPTRAKNSVVALSKVSKGSNRVRNRFNS